MKPASFVSLSFQFALQWTICDPLGAYGALSRAWLLLISVHLLLLSMPTCRRKCVPDLLNPDPPIFHAFADVFLKEPCRLHPLHNCYPFLDKPFRRSVRSAPFRLLFKTICPVSAFSSLSLSRIAAL